MMKKVLDASIRTILLTLFLIPLILNGIMIVSAAVPKASKASTIQELRQELASLQAEKTEAENKKKLTQSEINNKKNQVHNAYHEKDVIAKQIEEATAEITSSELEIARVTKETDDLLRFLQISNSENLYFEYIFDATSISDFITRAATIEQLTEYNNAQLKYLEELITKNQNLKTELAAKNVEMDNLISDLSSKISSLGNQLAAISDMNEDINSQIKNQSALIDYYKGVCKSETQKLDECTDLAATGGFIRPLKQGKVNSQAGYRTNPLTGKIGSFHNGVDIGVAEGTPVYASALGRVAAITRRSSCGGNIVYIHHNINGSARTTHYAHLLEINDSLKVGSVVTIETQIGRSGGSSTKSYDSCTTGAHLHYGIAKGHYLAGGSNGYSKWATFLAQTIYPVPGFPAVGVYFYTR